MSKFRTYLEGIQTRKYSHLENFSDIQKEGQEPINEVLPALAAGVAASYAWDKRKEIGNAVSKGLGSVWGAAKGIVKGAIQGASEGFSDDYEGLVDTINDNITKKISNDSIKPIAEIFKKIIENQSANNIQLEDLKDYMNYDSANENDQNLIDEFLNSLKIRKNVKSFVNLQKAIEDTFEE